MSLIPPLPHFPLTLIRAQGPRVSTSQAYPAVAIESLTEIMAVVAAVSVYLAMPAGTVEGLLPPCPPLLLYFHFWLRCKLRETFLC